MVSSPRAEESAESVRYSYKELLTYRILVLSNTLGKGAVRFYTRRLGIPLAEWRLIAALALHEPISMNALSAELNTDKAWISRVVAALIKKGLVKSNVDEIDARKVILSLTEQGKALYEKAVPLVQKRQEVLLSVLTKSESEMMDRLLSKLQRRAEEMLRGGDLS
jgi:DNA-binding MarR family transcriptional regulator